ncbi:MAG TPA: hypothetical protein PL060_02485 [bacterium]|nr:hypothetical protein [bacterium]
MEKTPLWEDILLIVSIIMLWPIAFKRQPFTSNLLVGISFIIVSIILFRRIKRFESLRKNKHE